MSEHDPVPAILAHIESSLRGQHDHDAVLRYVRSGIARELSYFCKDPMRYDDRLARVKRNRNEMHDPILGMSEERKQCVIILWRARLIMDQAFRALVPDTKRNFDEPPVFSNDLNDLVCDDPNDSGGSLALVG